MKVFGTEQIRAIDRYTIQHEPISSLDLMERVAQEITSALTGLHPFLTTAFCVFAGPGNNGGDGLAVARMLRDIGYQVHVYLINEGKLSDDCNENRIRLLRKYPEIITEFLENPVFPELTGDEVIIDALFGSGLSRPLSGMYARYVEYVNSVSNQVIAIDIPSGLNGDSYHRMIEKTVKADITLTLQFPKKAFFFIENHPYVGRWQVVDIGLHPEAISQTETPYYFQDLEDVRLLLKKRSPFSHKGTFGHLAIIAGSKGMAGASILASQAALRSGAGVVTLHGPEGNRNILQTIVPEVIFDADKHPDCVSEFYHAQSYDAVAIGSGIGTRTHTVEMLNILLQQLKYPCVLDADALNILASQRSMLQYIPRGSILTPHPKEFARMFGESVNSFCRLERAIEMAAKHEVIIVLKGAYTRIVTPDGRVYFNSSGNPGMATAGSGDVLTGILGALLAQNYEPEAAARLGVYLHGLSADLALEQQSEESLMAGDIVQGLGRAFKFLRGLV